MAAQDKAADPFDLSAGVPPIEGDVRPKPKFADRISKRVVVVAGVIALVMIGLFFASLEAMDRSKQARKEANEAQPKKTASKPIETVAPKELVEGSDGSDKGKMAPSLVTPSPDAGGDLEHLMGGAGRSASLTRDTASPSDTSASGVPKLRGSSRDQFRHERPMDDGLGAGAMTAETKPIKTLTPEQQAAEQAKLARMKRMQDARANGLVVASYSGEEKKGGLGGALPQAANALLQNLQGQAIGGMGSLAAQQGQIIAGAQRGADSEQDQKAQFIKTAGKDERGYLQNAQTEAASPNEVKRGAYIPLRLEVAINSGQPGMVKARVTEDVYDTITGCRLLIPAMTTVQGTYDSRVAIGQTRNLVVWNHLGFEDGSELNLGAMQGYDSSGAAGIEADVDNHYARMFGLAFGMSLVTAGVQQSVSPPPANSTGMSTQQAISTSLAQQYGQLGAQILGKQMQIQPTLRNFPGERFVIMTPSTIGFKKVWRNRCL